MLWCSGAMRPIAKVSYMLIDEQMFRGCNPRKFFLEDFDLCDRVGMKEFAELRPRPKMKADDHLNVSAV